MRTPGEIPADLKAAKEAALRHREEGFLMHEHHCRLLGEAREHPEFTVEEAGQELGLPRRTAYEYAKAADDFDVQRP